MAQRFRYTLSIVVIASIALFSGCVSGGDYGSYGSSATGHRKYTSVTSSDGNAMFSIPSWFAVSREKISVIATTPSETDPNAIPGTFYECSAPMHYPPGTTDPPATLFVALKYDKKKLPAGVTPDQLIIVSYLPGSAYYNGSDFASAGRCRLDPAREVVYAYVTWPGTFGLGVSSPFAGGLSGRWIGPNGADIYLNIDTSGDISSSFGGTEPFEGTGFVDNSGAISFTGDDKPAGPTINFTGFLHDSADTITGSGTWTDDNRKSGTWSIP